MAVAQSSEVVNSIPLGTVSGACSTTGTLYCQRCRMSLPKNSNTSVDSTYGVLGFAQSTSTTSQDGCVVVDQGYFVLNCLYYNEALECDQCYPDYT